jgi:hypothetical protein
MTESLNSSIEIHDSVLISVEVEAIHVKLSIEAYIHKSTGVPGVDPGTGWVQNVVLKIQDGIIEGHVDTLPCDLYDGTLQIDGNVMSNVIPLPLDRQGSLTLTLVAQSNERIIVRGTRVAINLLGEPEYIEEFSP